MKVIPTAISEVVVIESKAYADDRGYFLESYNARDFVEAGIDASFVQDNLSHSVRGVVRGLHFQSRHPQGKLVRCFSGEIFDVAVDIRPESKTSGSWVGVTLTGQNLKSLWIPPGFAHGFMVLSERADVAYKCTEFYDPEFEHTLRWNDPSVGIDWPLVCELRLSPKDARGLSLEQVRRLTAE